MTVEERLDEMTDNKRIAARMMRWKPAQWREWYGHTADHVERTANRASAEVRNTLSWSLPFLRRVQRGEEEPVLPPKNVRVRIPQARIPGLEVKGAILPPTRKRLSIRAGKKAPAMEGMSDVVEE